MEMGPGHTCLRLRSTTVSARRCSPRTPYSLCTRAERRVEPRPRARSPRGQDRVAESGHSDGTVYMAAAVAADVDQMRDKSDIG